MLTTCSTLSICLSKKLPDALPVKPAKFPANPAAPIILNAVLRNPPAGAPSIGGSESKKSPIASLSAFISELNWSCIEVTAIGIDVPIAFIGDCAMPSPSNPAVPFN